MSGQPFLRDVRQIGPESDRDISGICSACGTIVLGRLTDSEKPNPERLRTELDKVFQAHVAETHSKGESGQSRSISSTAR
jgi:hypothetical protein